MLFSTSKQRQALSVYNGAVLAVLFSVVLLFCSLVAFADKREITNNNNKAPANPYGNTPYNANSVDPWDPDPGGLGYDETSIFINVQRIGGIEVPGVIKNRVVYLPITTIFDFLKIKNETTPGFDSVFGYFIDQDARYCIDNARYQIRYKGSTIQLL